MQRNLKKFVRNILISVIGLLVILAALAMIYVWYSGHQDPAKTEPTVPAATTYQPFIKPKKPGPNVPVGVAMQSMTSPVAPGETVSLDIRTRPDATCNISAVYNKTITERSPELITKTADDFGMVNWSWVTDRNVPLGKWPVTITCVYEKKSGVLVADLVIALPKNN